MANIGRAILAGLSAGMKSQADQIGADINLDNQVRLLAVQDMIHQRAAEQGHSWDIENREDEQGYRSDESQKGRDFSAQQAKEGRDWELKLKTDSGIATQMANADAIGMRSKANTERDITKELDKDTDYKQSVSNMAKAKDPYTGEKLEQQDRELTIKQQHERTLEAKVFGVDSDGNQIGNGASGLGSSGKGIKAHVDNLIETNKYLEDRKSKTNDKAEQDMLDQSIRNNVGIINQLNSMTYGGNQQQGNGGSKADNADYSPIKPTKNIVSLMNQIDKKYGVSAVEEKYGLPRGLMLANIAQESAGDPNAVSKTGVKGLAQVTGDNMVAYGYRREDRTDPQKSLDVGARMLSELLNKLKDPHAAAIAYNSGEEAGRNYLRGKMTEIREEGKKHGNIVMSNYNAWIKSNSNDTEKPQPERQESIAQPQAEQTPKKRLFALNGKDNDMLNEAINNGQFGEGKVAEDKYNLFNTMYRYTGNYQKSMMAAMGGEVAKNEAGQAMPGHYRLSTGELVVDPEIQAAMDKAVSMSGKVNSNPGNESPTPRKGLLADIPKKGDTIPTKEQQISFSASLDNDQKEMFYAMDDRRRKSILDIPDDATRRATLDKMIEAKKRNAQQARSNKFL